MSDLHSIALSKMPVAEAVGSAPYDIVQESLRSVRTHLGMEIAYLSEFVDGKSVFRAVDAPGLETLIKPGDQRSLDEVYCLHICDGTLPQLMPDTSAFPVAAAMPITNAVPIGAHVSVPIEREDGSQYGMFCCLSPTPNVSLNDRDLNVARMFARLAQREVQNVLVARRIADEALSRIDAVMQERAFSMAFQPIHDLASREVSGFEALCRFHSEPYRTPDKWFAEAAELGIGDDLEYCVLEATLSVIDAFPKPLYLSVNAGPDLVASGRLKSLFAEHHPHRMVLELTEHAEVLDHAALARALADLRALGVRIAVDDAGAGYSGLQQLVRLKPEIIKLDRSLVSGVHDDPALRSLCAALLHYAKETGAVLVAEGIETEQEAWVLQDLGVHRGQGWLLGKPMDLPQALTHAGMDLIQPFLPQSD